MENEASHKLQTALPALIHDLNALLAQYDLSGLRIKRLELIEKDTPGNKPAGKSRKKNQPAHPIQAEALKFNATNPPPVPEGCTAKFSASLKKWIIICP